MSIEDIQKQLASDMLEIQIEQRKIWTSGGNPEDRAKASIETEAKIKLYGMIYNKLGETNNGSR